MEQVGKSELLLRSRYVCPRDHCNTVSPTHISSQIFLLAQNYLVTVEFCIETLNKRGNKLLVGFHPEHGLENFLTDKFGGEGIEVAGLN